MRYTLIFFLAILLTACGTQPTNAISIANVDPVAPRNRQNVTLLPPEGWTLNSTGSGITDGQWVVTAMTFSDPTIDPSEMLESVIGEAIAENEREIILQRNMNRLMAWTIIDGTLTTLTMQSRAPSGYTDAQEQLLIQLAASANF
jgi:hypothetical protein